MSIVNAFNNEWNDMKSSVGFKVGLHDIKSGLKYCKIGVLILLTSIICYKDSICCYM